MIASVEDLSDEQRNALKLVTDRFHQADKLHNQYRPRWNTFYGLYRNYRKLKEAHAGATTSAARADVLDEFAKIMGKDLFIPYSFSTVETVIPRILAQDPVMRVRPNHPDAQEAAQPVRQLFHRDQQRMKYSSVLQAVARTAAIYGLGVQKLYWKQKYRSGRATVPSASGEGYQTIDQQHLVYRGPCAEDVDIFDFFWSPSAKDIETAEWVIHRTWRTDDYVARMVKQGAWFDLDLEQVKGLASDRRRGEVWGDRMEAMGISDPGSTTNPLHEVWEYWDRENVYTVIDESLLVKHEQNPHFHGDLPFQIFRPTPVPSEFVGIGEIEPLAHLQWELNDLRTGRRDAAMLALNRGYFYDLGGGLNPNDMVTGPNAMVPVMGDPKDVIYPMPIQDVPGSSVNEEDALKSDIERTSGISDPVSGTNLPGSSSTATGIQLVQSAANHRLSQKAKNILDEVVTPGAGQMLHHYRQYMIEDEQLRVPGEPDPETGEETWQFVGVGPEDVQSDLEIIPEPRSTEAENDAQKRADATQLMQAIGPLIETAGIDPNRLAEHVLYEFGVQDPEDWLLPTEPEAAQVFSAIGRALDEMTDLDRQTIEQVLQAASQLDPQQQHGPPQAPPQEPAQEGAPQQ